MSRVSSGQLEAWEVGLIKRMGLTEDYNNQQIQAFFTRPDRSINQARITEIIRGDRFAGIPPSTQEELNQFLLNYQQSRSTIIERPQSRHPLDEQSVLNALQLTDSEPPTVGVDESELVEWKKSFNWSNRAAYIKTIVGLANNRGGYLVFGIDPQLKQVIGITPGKLDGRDSADIAQFLGSCFSPTPNIEKREIELRGFNIGVIHVGEFGRLSKPIVCQRQVGKDLREGDIFYRYPGLTTRIRFSELLLLLQERDAAIRKDWMNLFERIEAHGPENVALFNMVSGEGEARGGKFLIEETLIDQLSFIREGEFSEKQGAPTLKLIGELQAIGEEGLQPVKKITQQITWTQSIHDFANRVVVEDPLAYIRALCHLPTRWLPIYYYIQQARISLTDAISLIELVDATHPTSQRFQIERLKTARLPSNVPARHTQSDFRNWITSKQDLNLDDPEIALRFLKATATLSGSEMELEYLFPRLSKCNDLHHSPAAPKDLSSWIKSAACVIDYKIYGKSLYESAPSSKKDSQFH